MTRLQIEPVPCLRDNYAYLIRAGDDAWLVDPSELGPPRRAIEGLQLRGIFATHHHYDHVGGIEDLIGGTTSPVIVAAHAASRGKVPAQNQFIDAPVGRFAPSGIEIGGRPVLAMWIPGHTLDAIAWYIPPERDDEGGDVFTGDTLFAAGCGRLFEGTPEQMHASLQALTALPIQTRLWFGHEYTASNLRFAAQVEPENPAIRQRQVELPACTTPTTVALERATNPFVRAATAEVLAERRAAKDTFRG